VCTTGDTAHIDTIFKFLDTCVNMAMPSDLADLKAQIIAAVKNIDAPMLTHVSKNLNIVSMCAVSPVVHTSNISSCKTNFFSFPVAVNNSI
jgi:hypothetical protein